ncbi:MAG: glycosyltransferase family 1 protein [Patescibacteria group bacterium]|nr:glycosyltransferase family 1 protein [Patescibacteria group bacterium]
MRIGVDFRGVLTGQISGVEQYTLQILKNLLAIDTTNTYVLFYVAYRDQDEVLQKLRKEYPFLANANVEVKKLKWVNFPLLLHAFFKPLNWPKADVICGGLDIMFMPAPRLLPLSRKCKKVTTFHDLIFLIYPQFYTLSSRLWQWQMSYPYEARTSDAVIAVSHTTKQDLVRLVKADPKKIRVVYEGVGKEYFAGKDAHIFADLKAKFNLPEKFIYYIGSIEPRKNLKSVILALKIYQQKHSDTMKLVLSGSKSWLSSDLYQLVQELGLAQDVIFTGRVSDREKIALMQYACAFVFPSFYEGFGLMVLEAFAAGCPVIISDRGALPEVAGKAALTVSPDDVQAMADALAQIAHDATLRSQLVHQGRLRAESFTWEKAAKQTLEIFQRVVKT